jgi:hypothetical protein
VAALTAGCSSVQISSGGAEDRTAYAEQTADRLRSEWASRLKSAGPQETMRLFLAHIEEISQRYLSYGRQMADRWEEGNQGRGTDMPSDEISRYFAGWMAAERPILEAYDDMAEYALDRISQSPETPEPVKEQLLDLLKQHYEVYNVLMFPQSTVTDYRHEIEGAVSALQNQIEQVEFHLQG